MCYFKRKATTTKPIISPDLILEVGLSFYSEINEIVQTHEIPGEIIIIIVQRPLPFAPISNYTLAEKSTSRASVLGTSDNCQITGTFGVTMVSGFLPIQSICEGKMKRCQPQVNFLN